MEKTLEQHKEEAREDIYRRVRIFENFNNDKRREDDFTGNFTPVAKEALYNYALSLLNVEYYKLPETDREIVLSQYK